MAAGGDMPQTAASEWVWPSVHTGLFPSELKGIESGKGLYTQFSPWAYLPPLSLKVDCTQGVFSDERRHLHAGFGGVPGGFNSNSMYYPDLGSFK